MGTAYDEAEIQKLLDAAKGTDLELPLYIEVCLGLRRGELLALKYSAIDWDSNTISIIESRVTAGNEVIVKCPKTQSGKRDLIVPAHLMKMLYLQHSQYLQQKLRLGGDFTHSDLVICQPNGKPYHPDHFAKKFRKLLKDHGLRKIRFHDLRHTNASLMIASGIDIKVAQQRLGHSDVTTTLNIYSHVLQRSNQEAANTLDSLIFKQSVNQ
jgi:integrase